MKKVLYIALIDVFGKHAESDGVARKIKDQCSALVDNGWDVSLLAFKDQEILYNNLNQKSNKGFLNSKSLPRRYRMFEVAKEIIAKENFDTVYIRYPYTDLHFLKLLKFTHRLVEKIYIELPTYPIERWRIQYGIRKFILSRMDQIWGRKLRKYVTKIRVIGIQTESVYGVKAENISNGISVAEYPEIEVRDKGKIFKVIAVSRMNHYHGYDRLIEGLTKYYKKNSIPLEVQLTLVGNGPMKLEWEEKARKGNVLQYINFVGEKTKEELNEYFDEVNLAIGSLGLHRVNLSEISTLKSKEYCARGIPFAAANKEIGFPENYPFIIPLTADESPVEIDLLIKNFNAISKKYPNYSAEMRKFATENLDWKKQMNIE